MIRENQKINDFFIRIGLIILFFLIIGAFSNNFSIKNTNINSQEIFSDLQSNHINAIVSNSIQLPDYQKNWLSFIDKFNFRYSDIHPVKYSDSKKITLVYKFLQNLQFKIKPKLIRKFYFCLSPPQSNSKELPVLS